MAVVIAVGAIFDDAQNSCRRHQHEVGVVSCTGMTPLPKSTDTFSRFDKNGLLDPPLVKALLSYPRPTLWTRLVVRNRTSGRCLHSTSLSVASLSSRIH